MTALLRASAISTCFGDGAATFAALCRGESANGPMRHRNGKRLGVLRGYHVPGGPHTAAGLLAGCVGRAWDAAGLTPGGRVVAVVGTGLRELAAVESHARTGEPVPPTRLHFRAAVTERLPFVADVVTIANACSAGGHALALAQDLIEIGDADVVVAAATDVMTDSMLAMIGRVAQEPTDTVRPFDVNRRGVLLGEGAAAMVLTPDRPGTQALGRLLATGLSCDAHHETAPDVDGIRRAMTDAMVRAGRGPRDVGLVVAHGTGTALNDAAESVALRDVLAGAEPLITAVKGAVGHTSGAAALVNVDVALRCLASRTVPPIVGLRTVLPEGAGLSFVRDRSATLRAGLAQVNAFGFGGVNAVSLVEEVL